MYRRVVLITMILIGLLAIVPVLLSHGAKDSQVTTEHMDALAHAFEESGHSHLTRLTLPNANDI